MPVGLVVKNGSNTLSRSAAGTPPPLPILSGHILRLADGHRSLLEIRAALHCGEQDLIEEFRYLVRSRRVRLLAGHQEFERFVR